MAENSCVNMKSTVLVSGVKPILKYRGGKSQELSNYLSYIPKFNTYYEPFFGGGATFFATLSQTLPTLVGSV